MKIMYLLRLCGSRQDAEVEAHLGHAYVLDEGVIDLRREEIVCLHAVQVLQDLIALRFEELAPQHLDEDFVEKPNALLVTRLVKNFVVDRP